MNRLSQHSERSSSSSSTHYQRYDVFLSFRGLDTRLNFTDHLYNALVSDNIITFLDDEEMETGEDLKPELVSAIKASRASIIVLSENYASSTWCLEELALILEQHRNSGLIVSPIFYHVDPTDVKNQQSSFGAAMAAHKQRMEKETNTKKRSQWAQKMELWNKALTEVANLRGENAKGRLETELIEEIVKDINHRLRLPLRSDLPPLIGVDPSIKLITSWLKYDFLTAFNVFTIFGISGIGKTSLAEYVYGLHRHVFDRSSFVKDISRSLDTKYNGMVDLQKQLCEDLSKRSLQGHDVSECTSNIAYTLAHEKVFLVLDDIDSSEQLDSLLGSKEFHPGSKVIITTKDVSLIESCALFNTKVPQEHKKLALQGLNRAESLKLFCIHAFICNKSNDGYEEVSKELVEYCAGHPLTLKVLGKLLRNQDVAYWEKHLKRLKEEKGSLINNVIRMSFDSLAYENDKELFKHIACFFVGRDRNDTETILRACGIHTLHGISNLTERCLLMIGPNNELMMHQLLQELGRDLVREESLHKPHKRSRLWCHEESYKVLKQEKGSGNLLGLALDMRMLEKDKFQGSFEMNIDALSTMEDLMLLQLNYVQLNRSIKHFPEKLRWLCMHGFPLKSIPLDLPMENLVALDLSYSNFETFDMSNSYPQRLEKTQNLSSQDKRLLGSLKILNLSFCKQLQSVGGFSEFPKLEKLTLTNCVHLIKVSESIEQCDELVLIDLSYCVMLEKLPRIMSKLKKIKALVLDGCNLGEFPTKTRDMVLPRTIKYHNLGRNSQTSSSTTVEAIPRAFKSFVISLPSSLVRLSLKDNNLSDESFPMDFNSLSMLEELYLDGNPIVSLPDCVKRLPRLEKLSMEKCLILKTFEHPPRTLKHLIFDYWHSLQKIVFDREMSPLTFSMVSPWPPYSGLVVEGIFKIEAMSHVAEEILLSLGWINMEFIGDHLVEATDLMRGTHKSQVQMDYEFGIFSTMYLGIDIPSWISDRREGSSISFTIPSSHYNLRGINFCHVISNPNVSFLEWEDNQLLLTSIRVSNITKNRTWIYNSYDYSITLISVPVIFLSHWMFGKNEMEDGDQVTISTKAPPSQPRALECGISLVYDDGKMEEDPLSYYKSWNHIIGGDLSAFQATRGEYLLDVTRFFGWISLYCPFFEDNCYYEEKHPTFTAFPQGISNVASAAPKDISK